MWYLAQIITAERKVSGRTMYQCESSNVLFQADSAAAAYRKAVVWGKKHVAGESRRFQLLGISHLSTVGEELGEGVDLFGRFFQKRNIWDRPDCLIPPPEELKAIWLEGSINTPLGELLSPYQIRQLKRQFDG